MPTLNRLHISLLLLLAIVILVACQKQEEAPLPQTAVQKEVTPAPAPPAPAPRPADAEGPFCPAPNGAAVMAYITKDNPYQNWDLWPGKGKLYVGQHPHGAFLTTYVSPLAHGAIEDRAGEIPDTAMIVKENYTAEKTLAAVTVMYKKTGYNPESGDWFYLKFTPDGTIEQEGKPAGCIACHAAQKDNDYLFTTPIK